MDGLLIIDKPPGCTSHDVVLRVRKLLGTRRVGHGGTLDPEATGVLLIALGQATRFFPYLSGQDKIYEGTIRLGYATDTYDASGHPTSEEKTTGLPSAAEIEAAMRALEGAIFQAPPAYSAKKVGGRPAYKLARARKEFILEPVRVMVSAFMFKNYTPPFVEFEAQCSSGTYIRSLAHDLGKKLGCGAHLHSLRRTSVGPNGLAQAVSLGDVEKAVEEARVHELIIPLEKLLPEAPAVVLSPGAVTRAKNGAALFPEHLTGPLGGSPAWGETPLFRVFDPSGKFLALARPSPDRDSLRPFLIVR
jgi:tRNA pseudouridine55 synthase